MSRFGTFAVILATSVALAATPALAVVKRATFKGVVAQGADLNGDFGTVGANLAGQAFTMSFDYDTLLGIRDVTASTDYITSDPSGVLKAPILSASLTINGKKFLGSTDSQLTNSISLDYSDAATSVFDIYAGTNNELPDGTAEQLMSISTAGPLRMTSLESNAYLGGIAGSLKAFYYLKASPAGGYTQSDIIQLDPKSFWITNAGVPEPANWAMMIAGFGLIGATQRRRRQSARSVAA